MTPFILAIFLLLVSLPAQAGPYIDSAHGNGTNGVKRTASQLASYSAGNCAHCHEQHASVAGVEPAPDNSSASYYQLFAPTNPTDQAGNFCFNCHQTTNSVQNGSLVNNNYAATFGGGTTDTTYISNDIHDAFNPTTTGSAHDLSRISTLLQSNWPAIYSANSNPCSACHNSHLAKKNNGTSYDPTLAAISLPDDRENLWGDDDGTGTNPVNERMSTYTNYRAPFYVGANTAADPTLHEPAGSSGLISSPEVKGLNTPDYNTLCLKCHSAVISGAPPIEAVMWGDTSVGQHGTAAALGTADATYGSRKAPYTVDGTDGTAEDLNLNFVLSCLDCHESHGSKKDGGEFILRTTVNGVEGIDIPAPGQWYNFCAACHIIPVGGVHIPTTTSTCNTGDCHGHSTASAANNF